MHECHNPYNGRIIKLNSDNSGVIQSNFFGRDTFLFTSDKVFGHQDSLKEGITVTFTLDVKREISCVHVGEVNG